MQILRSKLNTSAAAFAENKEANHKLITKLGEALKKSREGGGEKYVTRHLDRGKLLPRERIELLLDPGTHFLELMPLAGFGDKTTVPGAGSVVGIGVVSGVECLVGASEATVKGGIIHPKGLLKGRRAQDIALENRLPYISCTESGGAKLEDQKALFVPGGAAFRDITRSSKQKIPTLSLVFGNCTAGGAYIPGLSDYVIMVDKGAKVFLAGPPLVKMATGEVTDDETLGGAEMHSKISGVSDYFAPDEMEAIRIARDVVGSWHWRKEGPGPTQSPEDPLYDPDELLGIIPKDAKIPYDIREVIARIVDGSRFHEFKAVYGTTLVTGFAFIHGYQVGIVANNGVLFSDSSQKGAQFIQLCNQIDVPILFLQNITGFMVGKQYEREGIIKHGAKMINAVSNSEVPHFTIMTGVSYGAGNYAMCGRAYNPRFMFSWPNHKIAVMGPDQLAGVLDIIQREAAAKEGKEVDEKQLEFAKGMLSAKIETESNAFAATAEVWDDGIIDPRHTRDVLGISLSAAHSRAVQGSLNWGVYRM